MDTTSFLPPVQEGDAISAKEQNIMRSMLNALPVGGGGSLGCGVIPAKRQSVTVVDRSAQSAPLEIELCEKLPTASSTWMRSGAWMRSLTNSPCKSFERARS